MILINDEHWQRFTFGRYIKPAHIALTPTQLKVYNMAKVGYQDYQIAERIGAGTQRIRQQIIEIKAKGWAI